MRCTSWANVRYSPGLIGRSDLSYQCRVAIRGLWRQIHPKGLLQTGQTQEVLPKIRLRAGISPESSPKLRILVGA